MSNKFFDIKSLSLKENKEEFAKAEKPYKAAYLVKHFEKLQSLKDLLRIPTVGEFFFLQSDGQFNAFTFIPFIAQVYPIKKLHAATYSISKKTIDAFIELHDKGIVEEIELLISDSMIKMNPSTIDRLMALVHSRPNFTVKYAWVHAKVTLIETHEHYYVIEGSGNFSENAQYEQYLFANDKGLYDFRMKLFTESKLKKYE